jgi:hypothetical protein
MSFLADDDMVPRLVNDFGDVSAAATWIPTHQQKATGHLLNVSELRAGRWIG